MSKELADRLEEVSEYLVLTRNIGMSNAAVLNEAIAALRSEPEYALIADDCGGPARKLYAAPSREPTHLYQCCDCGRKSWDDCDELEHCNLPQPNGKRCAGQMLPIAPSRESRTDHQEPALSAEQRVIALLEENRKASCERPTGEAMYSNTARRYLIEDRHKAVETLCLQIAKEADATALRSLTARDEGIEAAAKAAHESLRDIDRAHAEIAYSAASALKGQP